MNESRGPADRVLAEMVDLKKQLARLEGMAAAFKRTEEEFKARLELEQAVSTMASEFLASPDIDSAIDATLGEIGELRGASRVYVFRFSEDGTTMANTHEWCAPGVRPEIENLRALPTDMFPWWVDRLSNGETIHVRDVAKLPPEAAAEREILESQDIKSVLVLPLHVGRTLAGFIGFDNVREAAPWSDDDITLLRLMSWILGNALDQAETSQALRESEERFRTVVEDLPALVCRFLRDGVLTFVNSAYCEYFGKTREELIGFDFFQFIPKEDQDNVRRHFLSLTRENPSITYDHKIIAPDGTTRWQQWTDRAIVDESGEVVEYQSIGRDITEAKLAEEGLKESEARHRQLADENAILAERARRDAQTKAILLREVNHRVKNNLTSIIGLLNAEARFARGADTADVADAMKSVAGRVQGMAGAHELLSAAGWTPLPLSQLAQQIIRLAWGSIPPERRIELEAPESDVRVTPEQATSLALVLNELATNTVKHAFGDRQTVKVRVDVERQGGRRASGGGAKDGVRLFYRDDGPGFPEPVLDGDRMDVGLYLIKNIVDGSLRGELKLRNDGGAVAEVLFPQAV